MRDANSGELVVHVSEAGDATALDLPDGISVENGPAICTRNDGCGEWSAYDLEITAAGTKKTVAYATSENVGPYRIVHGGNELQAPQGGTLCPDWFVAHAAIGITLAE